MQRIIICGVLRHKWDIFITSSPPGSGTIAEGQDGSGVEEPEGEENRSDGVKQCLLD